MGETMPKTLTLRGETLECIDALPPGNLFELAEMTTTDDVMKTMHLIGRFLEAVVVEKDAKRYRALVYDKVNVVDLDELSEECGRLIREYAGRPTSRLSDSPPGSSPTGETSRVVSFSRGTVEEAPTSSPDGQSSAS